jgi:DnaJ domain
MPTPPRPRFKSDIRINKSGRKVEAETNVTPCSVAGCVKPGNARIPKSRDNLNEYVTVCAPHARAFNESWDFFKGMGDDDMQKFREEAQFGHRPTWPMGKRGAKMRAGQAPGNFHDGHAVFDEDGEPGQVRRPERQLTRLQAIAMDTLQLAHNATLVEIKARYKELVKRFHPDANGGDRGAEERLKQVIKAYGVLRASGLLS